MPHFTLPDHERTSVHNRKNWLYDLDEPIWEPEETYPEPEIDPETPPHYYDIDYPENPVDESPMDEDRTNQTEKTKVALETFQTEITRLKGELANMHADVICLRDIAVEQFDHLNQAVNSIRLNRG